MAPEKPNQKRKRGGPAALPVLAKDASGRATRSRGTDTGGEAPADEHPADAHAIDKDENHNSPVKRGRPRKGERKVDEGKADAATGGVRRSNRDRRSADDSPWWISNPDGAEEQNEEVAEKAARPKKRARLSHAPGTTASKKAVEPEPEPQRRGRPRKSDAASAGEDAEQLQSESKRRGRPRKSGGPPEGEAEPPVEQDAQPKRTGRPRLSDASAIRQTPTRSHNTKAVVARSRPTNTSKEPARRQSRTKGSEQADKSVAELDEELAASLPPIPKYRQIQPRIRHIPRSTITDKWSPLDDAAIEAISSIISDTAIPVLHRVQDNNVRHQNAQKILRIFAGRLWSKLRKGMPFPPPSTRAAGTKSDVDDGRVEELSYQTTVESIASLETVLNPILHSVSLLEREKVKEEAALEKEYENLRVLEANARAETGSWRERLKKSHPLAPDPRRRENAARSDRANGSKLELVKHEPSSLASVIQYAEDEGLLAMSKQITSHMLSIEKNVQPVQDVLPAMAKSRAALQGVLQTHLAPHQLERVLLG